MSARIDPKDIVGVTYGQLTVQCYDGCEITDGIRGCGKPRKFYHHLYLCTCSCGTDVVVRRVNLMQNHTLSCGCRKRRRGSSSRSWGGCGEISGRFWTHIQRHASDRGLAFEITIQQAWAQFNKQQGRCALTGWPISVAKHKVFGKYTERTASLDRIDSIEGYTPSNIQWVHKDVNKSKMDFGQEHFIAMCRAVVRLHGTECSDKSCDFGGGLR